MPKLLTTSYVRRTDTRIITLACEHTRIFVKPWPLVGEVLWCPRCQCECAVTQSVPEFRASCEDCHAGRKFGRAEENAYRFAVLHRRRRPGHIVQIYDGTKKIRTFGNNDPQLPLAAGDCPF